jgi:hypothetical protein
MSYLPAVPEALATLRRGAVGAKPAAAPAAVVHAQQLGVSFLPGVRVLDQQTGIQGTVESSAIAHGVKAKPAAAAAGAAIPLLNLPAPTKSETVTVKLDSGEVITRDPARLVAIPAGLTVPLEAIE